MPFAGRGARAEGALRLFGHGGGPFEGEHDGFGEGVFAPVPSTPVPIMLGGVSDIALRRAAAYADVWQSLPSAPAEFADRMRRLADALEPPA
ncbi:LLM class flavin-dependent oxidoreductase [Allonocardiopsis opalescens]|uniref:Luciferase-like monooxygenase n=1 Tax=Allonocardiopsis opalescens TaxID=1144618 RepID=A0A2T0Q515_9ACTN|nr:LLM class flavin-dependent oxidoreductase [Allonocardiopsis opalescens]PRX98801.1 luciferase-like monooxygenase [Allonocardiopsis opalescens]